jgi:hypothetical protein
LVTELHLVSQTLHKFHDKIDIGVDRLFERGSIASSFNHVVKVEVVILVIRSSLIVVVFISSLSLSTALVNGPVLIQFQGFMSPEWCCAMALDLKEEHRRHTFNILD